jgi:hypothetical protein
MYNKVLYTPYPKTVFKKPVPMNFIALESCRRIRKRLLVTLILNIYWFLGLLQIAFNASVGLIFVSLLRQPTLTATT